MSVTISTDGEKTETASFDALFRSVYDTKFTTDISNRMHMPERIGAVNNHMFYHEDSPVRSQNQAVDILHSMGQSVNYIRYIYTSTKFTH